MAKFSAYKTKDDLPVTFTDIEDYYKKILQDAFPATFFLNGTLLPIKIENSEIEGFESNVAEEWGTVLFGYIQVDNLHASSPNSIFNRIASIEKKYYFKLLDDFNNNIKNNDGETILDRLARVDVNIYFSLLLKDSGNRNKFIDQASIQQIKKSNVMPFLVSSQPGYENNGLNYVGVYVNHNVTPLFLDTDEDTRVYQFREQRDGIYKAQYTKLPGRVGGGQLDETNHSDYFAQTRYLLSLKQSVNREAYAKNGKVKRSIRKSIFKILQENGENPNDSIPKSEEFILNYFTSTTAESDKEIAKQIAIDKASILPGDYRCFYGINNDKLAGMLSSANIGGGGGGGGYAMRADKVDEVDYQWSIQATGDDLVFAKLLSYAMNLDPARLISDTTSTPVSIYSNSNQNGYYPTNWPTDRQAGFRSETNNAGSWFQYYKKFIPNQKRRNKPEKPNAPRISHKQTPAYNFKYDNKQDFKLDNRSYRVWKKGNEFEGMPLGKGVGSTRLSAGSVMGKALNQFSFYSGMKKTTNLKGVTNASLSATSFAKYVVANDDATQVQWRYDNGLAINATINLGSVETDQEWCHLFGHGDGGTEELGNFVSGSKHCNTEQLAIETGQRRISQNESIDKKERAKLKANITAYLLPNSGTWVSKEFTVAEVKNLWGKMEYATFKKYVEGFFIKKTNALAESTYILSDLATLQTTYKTLSDDIKEKKNLDKKKASELFQFRRNLESSFFIFLPVARWIRYKIFFNNKKIFDHIFDAQSQSFDFNEAQILDYTVERAISRAMGLGDVYKAKIEERVSSLVPNDNIAKLIKQVIDIDNGLEKETKNIALSSSELDALLRKATNIPFSLTQSADIKEIEAHRNNGYNFVRTMWKSVDAYSNNYTGITKKSFLALSQQEKNASKLEPILSSIEGEFTILRNGFKALRIKFNNLDTTIVKIKKVIARNEEIKEALLRPLIDEAEQIKADIPRKREREYDVKSLKRQVSRVGNFKKLKKQIR